MHKDLNPGSASGMDWVLGLGLPDEDGTASSETLCPKTKA